MLRRKYSRDHCGPASWWDPEALRSEIIRDLVEKLPVMITPRWLETRTQPIAVRNVLQYLEGVPGTRESVGQGLATSAAPRCSPTRRCCQKFAAVQGLATPDLDAAGADAKDLLPLALLRDLHLLSKLAA